MCEKINKKIVDNKKKRKFTVYVFKISYLTKDHSFWLTCIESTAPVALSLSSSSGAIGQCEVLIRQYTAEQCQDCEF